MLDKLRIPPVLLDLATLLAGLGVPLAFAPFEHGTLVYPALVVLLASWQTGTPGRAFWRGYLFGFGLFGFGVYWLHISINLFGGVNMVLALAATYLLVAFLALYPALVGWLLRRFFSHRPAIALLLAAPALWVLAEWLRSWLFTGFPWLNLGYSQLDLPLAGFMPLLGVYGVSWLVVLLAGLLTLTVLRTSWQRRTAAIAAGVALVLLAAAVNERRWTSAQGEPLQAALVQGAVPQALKWKSEQLQNTMRLYRDLSAPHWQQADLIIWPETAIPAFAHQIDDYLELLREQSRVTDTPLVLGLATREAGQQDYHNSILSIGHHEDVYHKRHLVPFGEYLPLKALLDPLLSFLQIPMSDFTPGTADRPLLELGTLTAGVSICYEDVFGEQVIQALPEAGVLINISNDAWFGDSIAPHQHLQMARARALESGRYMLRATNTGISAIIDERGRIKQRSPQFEPDALIAEMRLFSGLTPYARFGNGVIIIICLLSLGVALWLMVSGRKQ
ncbi:apolipoprotein N-acyltransferase [Methylohalomonas lacus]|uniref:Apolipoprotein N-acyltransferase n=1 Tax=Methylohalomonas lacus TaxID=398773 RepID=A0AAE3HKP7_9GAMM|nr:apolipoprotein N-acyltransferase [Methylohalomonas lacus]MCS3904125.1 apolipoprotein N-acyltransferase [Methylohalomonas lacus]